VALARDIGGYEIAVGRCWLAASQRRIKSATKSAKRRHIDRHVRFSQRRIDKHIAQKRRK